jgi:putative ABC transport system permease protein
MDYGINILLAWRAIKANLLRTVLTFLIIAVGIMALVGILTAIDSMKSSIVSNFSSVGANSFTIRTKGLTIRGKGGSTSSAKTYRDIDYDDAMAFKEKFTYPAQVSLSNRPSMTSSVKYQYEKTNPNVTVVGVDENYISISGFKFQDGRNFSNTELETGANAVILGSGVANNLFRARDTMLNKMVSVGNIKYKVIGVLESKGSSVVSSDNMVVVPLQNARKVFAEKANRYVITINVDHPEQLDAAIEEATGAFRTARQLRPRDENDFEINRSDKLASTVIDQISYITLAATMIGVITMLGAGVGLMNIMLVSVSERTREIGISKALGANNATIKRQFLVEAVLICQIGGVLGIILGMLAGNVVSVLLSGSFVIPWLWIGVGIVFCLAIGLLAGLYPAIKASKLDPIEALRYE